MYPNMGRVSCCSQCCSLLQYVNRWILVLIMSQRGFTAFQSFLRCY
uniref:Uncharacterized protein n=2 Tax=Anguilla anguilla TaxID=7936 RepID=A0A0E9SGE0_ANGAN